MSGPAARVRAAEATAPARVGLAGGPPAALAVSVAIDRRAWCRVETGVDGVQVESKDTLQKAAGRTASEVIDAGRLTLAAHILRALGIDTGVRVLTQSRVPVGAGLGGSSALAVALGGAVAMAFQLDLAPEAIAALVRDAGERATLGAAGVADAPAAIHGGAVCLQLEPPPARIEPLAVDPARIEEALLLVDAGVGVSAGADESAGGGRVADGSALAALTAVARRVREALLAGRFEELVELMAEESARRCPVRIPAVEHVVEVVRAAGGGARPCGPSGGIVAVWAPPGRRGSGRREAVLEAVRKAGLKLVPARVDLRGLEVEAGA